MDVIKHQSCAEGSNDVVLEIERTRQDGTTWTETVRIEPHELIKMTDNTISYDLKYQSRPFKPKYVKNFDYIQSAFVSAMYDISVFSTKEYTAFCRARLDASLKQRFPKPSNQPLYMDPKTGAIHEATSDFAKKALQKRLEFCSAFFACLPEAITVNYEKNYGKFLSSHNGATNQSMTSPIYAAKVGGEVYGFWTDEQYRTRPLTSRKEDVLEFYPDFVLEQLQMALSDELKALENNAG